MQEMVTTPEVWHLMRTVLLLAVPLALVGVVGAVVRPEALETWAGAAISAALLLVLTGLGSALLRRASTGAPPGGGHRQRSAAGPVVGHP